MEDLIYLIILIAWAAFAFYRHSQKKKAAARKAESASAPAYPEPEPSTGQKDKSWEEILFGEEIPEEHELEMEVEKELPTMEKTAPYQPVSLEQMYMQRKIESLEDPAVQKELEKQKSELLKGEDSKKQIADKKDHPMKDFDLRKAVIYAEILRRPYE
jgi:hypothetical protein